MKGRRALVTGGSRGIGGAIALALARAGHEVVINYRSRATEAEALLEQIRQESGTATLVPFDVRDRTAVNEAFARLDVDARPFQILVNNAGIARDNPLPAIEPADWTDVISTTLDGFYNVTRPLLMPMLRTRWGRIINVSSVSGVMGNRGQVNYSAAKAGLIGATRSLSLETAKRNVTVNAIAPGLIETEMSKTAPLEEILQRIPMRRIGKPEEVAALAMFLVGEQASYITGQVIGINGGLV